MICQWFGIKITGTVWPQNLWLRVFRFGDLGMKITMMVFSFVPQNQMGYGVSVVL
jgi:hypothetical protein